MAHRAACVKVLTCLFLLFFLFSPETARPAASPRTVLSVGISGPGQVRAYVGSKPPYWEWIQGRADWIVGHESRYGKKMRGDDGQSRGYWMISSVSHPEAPDACADDLICSTN